MLLCGRQCSVQLTWRVVQQPRGVRWAGLYQHSSVPGLRKLRGLLRHVCARCRAMHVPEHLNTCDNSCVAPLLQHFGSPLLQGRLLIFSRTKTTGRSPPPPPAPPGFPGMPGRWLSVGSYFSAKQASGCPAG